MLDRIVKDTRRRIAGFPPDAELQAMARGAPPVRDLAAGLTGNGLAVIAEVKRRSPSRGDLDPGLDPAVQAARYAAGGAAAISVLTEPSHFSGSNQDLAAARAMVDLPMLRKDFTLVASQIWEARSLGADAILLIVGLLDDRALAELAETAAETGMAALVEVHNEEEVERAGRIDPVVVGVNNRDLWSFAVDLSVAERLAPLVAGFRCRVAESGIRTPADAARMAAAGYQAVLVGESLIISPDPAGLIASMGAM